ALKPAQRKHPEVVAVVDDENARHVPGKGRRNADFMQSAADNPPKAVFLLRRHRGRYPGGVQSQSSVNASQAMLSQATLSQATLSHATLSQATLSQATLSQATLSQAKLSQATLFQTRVSQVSSDQKMPPASGSCHCSGEPKRTGYSARANPSPGRRPRLAQATRDDLKRMPTRNPPDQSPGLGAASRSEERRVGRG